MERTPESDLSESLAGKRVIIFGKLAGMTKRDAVRLLREHGAIPGQTNQTDADMVIIGEDGLPLDRDGGLDQRLASLYESTGAASACEFLNEAQLWERLGLVEAQQNVRRLYTPAMLADLLEVPLAVVRRWHRRGLIIPSREVHRLPYFDFQEVATARRLAELLAAGVSAPKIEKQLAALARFFPDAARPLAQLSIIAEGKSLLLRQGAGLIDSGGQYRFDFDEDAPQSDGPDSVPSEENPAVLAANVPGPQTVGKLVALAGELEDVGELDEAAEMYRAALAAGGPDAEICFHLAELLYRIGDPAAARERYYVAIELNEELVEARANLGCVLAELDQCELAVAAFEGALRYHPDFPDVHYHLARTLDELDRRDEAEQHWRQFLELAPDSPWADEARRRCR